MKIEAEDFGALPVGGEGHLRRAIEFMSPKFGPRFIILSSTEEDYIQAAFQTDNDLVIECRRGGGDQHFRAIRSANLDSELFSKDEVADAFVSYWRGEDAPSWLTWQRTTT